MYMTSSHPSSSSTSWPVSSAFRAPLWKSVFIVACLQGAESSAVYQVEMRGVGSPKIRTQIPGEKCFDDADDKSKSFLRGVQSRFLSAFNTRSESPVVGARGKNKWERRTKIDTNKSRVVPLPAMEHERIGDSEIITLRPRRLQGSNSVFAARVWALTNTEELKNGWRIFEFSFYDDETCGNKLEPVSLVDSGHAGNMAYTAEGAADGHVNTMWVASCGETSSSGAPCKPKEAYIGADFGEPVVVHCTKLHQASYGSPKITLVKEGTSAGFQGNLWIDVASWGQSDPVGSEPTTLISGINSNEESIQYETWNATHCFTEVYGNVFPSVKEAQSSCIADPNCGAVYDEGCEPLVYSIILKSSEDYDRIMAELTEDVIEPTKKFEPAKTQYVVSASFELNKKYVLLGSVLTEADYDNLKTNDQYPVTVSLSLEVSGSIRLCKRQYGAGKKQYGAVRNYTSTEGSCVYVKTGALLDFSVRSNMKMPSDDLIFEERYEDNPSGCAEECLKEEYCEAFEFIHKNNGEALMEINCRLATLCASPPNPGNHCNFDPDADLVPVDGQLDVIDLYLREMAIAASEETVEVTSTTVEPVVEEEEDSNSSSKSAVNVVFSVLIGVFCCVLL